MKPHVSTGGNSRRILATLGVLGAIAALSALAAPAFASATYSSAVLADGPLVYYHLDEASGPVAADSSGSSPAVDGAYSPGGVSYGVAGAFLSTGTGQAITLTTGTVGATLAATAQTAEFWVKPSVRTPQTLIHHGDPGADGWAIGIAPTNTTRGGRRKLFFQSHGLSVNSKIALASGAWTMVDVTWDAAHVNFTVNGGAISKALKTPSGWTVPGPASDTALTLGPGAGVGGTSFDEVALFGSALTPGQIAAHYAATLLPQSLLAPVLAPLSGVRDGDALTLTPGSYAGGITPSEQWQRCDVSAVCSDIPGATGTFYTLTPEDVDDAIQVQESASNANGSTSVISDATDPVLARTPFITDQQPSVSGTPSAGQTLAGGAGHWGGTPTITFAYQWQRCDAAGPNCLNIPGATSATYAVDGAADAGVRLLVAVTATNAGGATTATSLATMTVPPPDTSPFGTPTPTSPFGTPTPPPSVDLTPPIVRVRALPRQRVVRTRALRIQISCNELCTTTTRWSVFLRNKPTRFLTNRVTRQITPPKTVVVKLQLSRKAAIAIQRTLSRHRRVTIRVTIVAIDQSNNRRKIRPFIRITR